VASVETRPVTRGLLLLIGDAGRRIRGPERFVAVLAASGFDSGRGTVGRRANYTAIGPLAKSEWRRVEGKFAALAVPSGAIGIAGALANPGFTLTQPMCRLAARSARNPLVE